MFMGFGGDFVPLPLVPFAIPISADEIAELTSFTMCSAHYLSVCVACDLRFRL